MSPEIVIPNLFPQRAIKPSALRAVLAFLLLAANLPFAFCQLNPRPPLTSGPAGVMLIATLESLTMGATPTSFTLPQAPDSAPRSLHPVSITTHWAIPSNLTTIRVAGYLQDGLRTSSPGGAVPTAIPTAAVRGQMATGIPDAFTSFSENAGFEPGVAGLTLLAQSSGNTNLPVTRTDDLNLEIDRNSIAGKPTAGYTGVLNLVVQAL